MHTHSCLKWLLVFLLPSDSFCVCVLTRHSGSVLQNWAGMRCPYKLLRMILALVCSKLSTLTRGPVLLVMLLLFMGGGVGVGGLCQVIK